jgi:DNA-binding FadR family transcriptional regulator
MGGLTGLTNRTYGPSRADVMADLEEALLAGRLRPGDRLPPERELAARYRISRPVIREVLRELVAKGLVEVSPGRGAFVLRPGLAQGAAPLEAQLRRQGATVRDVTEARLMLECEAAELAARRADSDDVLALERMLDQLERAETRVDRIRRDLAFHMTIASATHNPVIKTMLAAIARLSVEVMVGNLEDIETRRTTDQYHREAVQAIRARDPGSARRAIRSHQTVARTVYGPDYDQGLDTVALRGLRALGYSDLQSFMETVFGSDQPSGALGLDISEP